ncbi:hypothetical protein H3U93_08055 [Bifidobacterium sp. W8115]|uniref:hypothetical protein n=1 Tax=Bifidobacterium TaxID=1678 RepID=UPI0018DCD2AF|nr:MULTISPECIES: hypothetical protein [Bifidobacterium]MBI0072331.1 hypothetical protein [Bifidobacterium sp. W8112]MBI0125506.1 hypothetical protein [Bifidobacterium apousia]
MLNSKFLESHQYNYKYRLSFPSWSLVIGAAKELLEVMTEFVLIIMGIPADKRMKLNLLIHIGWHTNLAQKT